MCGIAGFCSKTLDQKQVILSMNERMLHRGPDAGGYYLDEKTGVTLGHRRLAIVDLTETGAQPMVSHDERYVLVYNGEIYNADSIRERLLQEGHVTAFKGSSDTEVLLEAIVAYGTEKALQMTKGMFAFGLYDKKTATITLARDRVGEKPLYYGTVNGDFVFCSEIGMLTAYPGFTGKLNAQALQEYLRYGYVPAPLSIYEGIYKCRPGAYITASYPYSEWEEHVYYNLIYEYDKAKKNPFEGSFEEAVDELEHVLKEAVKSQMMADVPLGAFLSGGIDSAAVVSLMQSMQQDKVKTFTIGFEEKAFDEASDAKAIAEYLGTEHTSLILSEKELKDVIPKIPDIFTEPFADSSQIPTYLVSKLAKSKVTVSLSGDAGDELFGGYNTYWKTAGLYRKLEKIPFGIRKVAGGILDTPVFEKNNILYRTAHCLKAGHIGAMHEAVCYDTTHFTAKLLTKEFAGENRMAPKLNLLLEDIEDEMMLRDLIGYHPEDILVKVDRAGMAVSLENRVPMLDKDVLALAYSLPVSYKLGVEDGKLISKYVLKEVLYRYVPKEIMERPKKGFSVPLSRWLSKGSVHEWAKELLADSYLVKDCILDGKTVNDLWAHFIKTGQNKGLLWNVLVLEQWYRKQKG